MLIADPALQSSPATSNSLPAWQLQIKQAIRDPAELCQLLQLPASMTEPAQAAAGSFPLFAPRPFVDRIQPGNPHDPLLLQLLPDSQEQLPQPGYSADPLAEQQLDQPPGFLQKYNRRALLVTTGACAIHCRYCFRREFPYQQLPHSLQQWQPALDSLRLDQSIEEVILSGGDPLMLVDDKLAQLVEQLSAIPHLQRLRIHTRLPIMIPERVCAAMLRWLASSRLQLIMVIHANHAAELDHNVAASLARLSHTGMMLLNQSVLLKNVNDTADQLAALSRRLIELNVLPYYLHQLDPVIGTAHFHVPIERGRQLIGELRQHLPGYAVPRYVQELPGEPSKTPLA